jgi:plasmid maintenance system antidote protein VapI
MTVKIKKEVVDDALVKMNKTQGWLADKLHTTPSHMNNILAGRVGASATIRENLMETLGVEDWDALFESV